MTLQTPKRRDYRQHLSRVAPWREEILPELKTTAETENRLIFSGEESACYLLPQVRPTWALAGPTPSLTEGCQSAPWSVISAISNHGDSYYQIPESCFTGSTIAPFLQTLLSRTPLLPKWHLIGDGASIPRSQEVTDGLRTDNPDGRVPLTLRPASSPQLRAAFQVWAWLKGRELQKVGGQTLDELTQEVQPAKALLTDQRELIRNGFTPPEVVFY